jgi:hypothetical protein
MSIRTHPNSGKSSQCSINPTFRGTDMNIRMTIATIVAVSVAAPVFAQDDAAVIRAGRNLATSKCFACHDISPVQAPPRIPSPGIPSFQEIANRPDITTEWLIERMGAATWHIPALPPTRLPMSQLSEREKSEAAAFILSLREHR